MLLVCYNDDFWVSAFLQYLCTYRHLLCWLRFLDDRSQLEFEFKPYTIEKTPLKKYACFLNILRNDKANFLYYDHIYIFKSKCNFFLWHSIQKNTSGACLFESIHKTFFFFLYNNICTFTVSKRHIAAITEAIKKIEIRLVTVRLGSIPYAGTAERKRIKHYKITKISAI